ncbi:pyridoxal phosphate-dependent transferase [Lophiotrema nucula]|uniref:Pyridoxal phosphate-dependent transferase n=1 Tax=Lophiotrema nucula TaxID=690887 RepID=A0A6A5ZEJ0_9PLEO|nr:pyridoxal phosphate-dependent transferase [Lophiotrema nucula]
MKQSRATQHNDPESFRSVVLHIMETQTLVRQGKRSIIIAVESVYSMDGDVCPLEKLLEIAEDISEIQGNIQFVVDEAHSVGVIGAKGAGLVCHLGLEKKIAVVVHSFGKTMGATGAIILGNEIIRTVLANYVKSIIFTTSPSLPFVAAIRAGYFLLATGIVQEVNRIQSHAKLFFEILTSHSFWPTAKEKGLLCVPLSDEWKSQAFFTHIITVSTRQKCTLWLYVHLLAASFCVFPVESPIVPVGKGRLRIILHADNTDEDIIGLIEALFEWAEEMIAIEEGEPGERESSVAKEVNDWMRRENLRGML